MAGFHIQVDAFSAMQASANHLYVYDFPALVVPNICLISDAVNDSEGVF
jgi:hypothetical protein